MKIERSALLLAGFFAVSFPLAANSQAFPTKPVRIVVPFPPGGVDVTIRLIQKGLMDDLGQPIIIENRPGANGYIGAEHVAKSAPDGYTLLAPSSALVIGPLISKDVPYDAVRDFTPIARFYRTLGAIVVHPSVPVGNIAQFIDYAKRNPGKLSYGSSGIGSAQHLEGEILKLATGIDMVHVPYKGGGPQSQAVVAGEIGVSLHPLQQVRALIASGKVKAMALYNANGRFAGLPDLPDMTEIVPGYVAAPSWVGILGPAKLAQPIVTRSNGAIVKSLLAPEVRAKLEENSIVTPTTPAEFAAIIKSDIDNAGKLVKGLRAAGVQFE